MLIRELQKDSDIVSARDSCKCIAASLPSASGELTLLLHSLESVESAKEGESEKSSLD